MKAARLRVLTRTAIAAAVLALLWPGSLHAQSTGSPGILNPELFDPKRPPEAEFRTHVPDGFTFTAVGDLIISRPLLRYERDDAGFQRVLATLKNTDVLYGNMETTILDMRAFKGFPYSNDGDWTNSSLPGVAPDLRAMGFDVVSRANNHALDWGIEGMRETSRRLDAAGIVWAGVGENRAQARAAAYYETPGARVGIVSFASTYRPTSDALPPQGTAPGRPGLSALAVQQTVGLPEADLRSLAAVACRADRTACAGDPATLSLFGTTYERAQRFEYLYTIDPEDLEGIESAIRSGKQNGDFLIATIHSHECSIGCDDPKRPMLPGAFLRTVAHRAIDSGADVFVTTGIHNLGPIEIYRGRPIFYGLGNFFWSDIQVPLPHDLFQENAALLASAYRRPGLASDDDLAELLNAGSFANAFTFQTVIARSTFERDRLARITLFAVDLGYGRKLTESGIPHLADASESQIIFRRIADATSQYGLPALDMRIDGSVATIYPPAGVSGALPGGAVNRASSFEQQ
ncbi:MAG TPA: CapA family protein [Candidatus Acidoferrales bacterium]|nr:CapA family protein [Candidatus Acidoferrales bacterium]